MDTSSSLASNNSGNVVGASDVAAIGPSSGAGSSVGGGGGITLHDNPNYQYIPPNSADPAWKWGAARSASNTTSIFCRLFCRTPSSGIKRFKEHLIGKVGNVAACPKATEAIKNEIIAYMNSTSRKRVEKSGVRLGTDSMQAGETCLPIDGGSYKKGVVGSSHQKGVMTSYLRPSSCGGAGDSLQQTTLEDGLFHVITILSQTMEEPTKVSSQLANYRQAIGPFGMALAIQSRKEFAPAEWWVSFGYGCRELQRIAIRVLSLTCSATPCERNWSTFEMIHTKKRNRLQHQKLNDLAYIQYNEKLRRRYEERKARGASLDPIILATVEDKDEYPSDDEYVDEEHDLTWRDVEIASGLSETEGTSTRSTTSRITYKRKNTSVRKQKGKRPAIIEEEEELGSEESEEEEFESSDSAED